MSTRAAAEPGRPVGLRRGSIVAMVGVRVLLPVLVLTACPASAPSDTDGGTSGGSTGGSGTSGGTTGGSTEVVTDSAGSTGAGGECSFEVTPAGGTVSACGLRLSLLPDAVAAPTTVTVTQPAVAAAVFDGLAQSSPVFRLETDEPTLELAAVGVLHVPHAAAESTWMGRLFAEYSAWGVLETCWRDAEWTGVRVTTLNDTYTALADVGGNDAPSGGAITATWASRMEAFAFDSLGHAHYIPLASGARSVDLYGVTTANGDPETLQLSFALAADGTFGAAVISMMVVDQGMYVSLIDWDGITPPSDVVLEVKETAPNHLSGSFAGTLYRDDNGTWVGTQVQTSFEADLARHFVPTDDPCPIE